MSYYASWTGLNSASAQLDTASNNIANANSVGFKRSQASFKDIYAATPQQPSAQRVGDGSQTARISQVFTQGALISTRNTLDLAISGEGFFQVQRPNSARLTYTRNGAFLVNANNGVVNAAGEQLMVAPADAASGASLQRLTPLILPPKTQGYYKTTSQLKQDLRLPSGAAVPKQAFDPNDPASFNLSTSVDLIDDQGRVRQGKLHYIKTQDANELDPYTEWRSVLTVDGNTLAPSPRTYRSGTLPAKTVTPDDIEWQGSGVVSDQLRLRTSTRPSTAQDALSVVDGVVYRGDGTRARKVGQVDAVLDGQQGRSLRIHLFDSQYANADFESAPDASGALPGWTVVKQQIVLDGQTRLAGWPTPLDVTRPSVSPGDGSAALDPVFSAMQLMQPDGSASAGLQLSGTVTPYGIAHGPALVSNTPATLRAGDSVSFDWKANGDMDAYDVYAYLLNVDTGETVPLLDQSGIESGQATDWTHVTAQVPQGGRYQFVFVSGSFDASGGSAMGATLQIDNVKTPPSSALMPAAYDALVDWYRDDTDGLLRFDRSGQLMPDLGEIRYDCIYGSSTALVIQRANSVSQSQPFAILSQSQNGAPEGELETVQIGNDGLVQGVYSNGVQLKLGRVMLGQFSNPEGLVQMGDARYMATVDSGQARLYQAGAAGAGLVQSGALEQANVDLTMEMTDLILAQRNFQANAKAVETHAAMTKFMTDQVNG